MPPSLEDFRERLANITIGSTTLRNQGASGVINAARCFLKNLDLVRFVTDNQTDFARELDTQTDFLRQSFPAQAQYWGTARKAINLFLAEAYYHRFICAAYHLETIEHLLELPLDSQVGNFLTNEARQVGEIDFPQWPGLKHLNPKDSKRYQSFANQLAKNKGWARVHLDVIIWKPEGEVRSGNSPQAKKGGG
jgi:hypothetical protein